MPLLTMKITEDERADLRALAGGKGKVGEYLRRLISLDATRRGLPWSSQTHDTRPDHWRGKWSQCPQCSGWNIGVVDGVKGCADCGWLSTDK